VEDDIFEEAYAVEGEGGDEGEADDEEVTKEEAMEKTSKASKEGRTQIGFLRRQVNILSSLMHECVLNLRLRIGCCNFPTDCSSAWNLFMCGT
jgi:hypothetical protein